MPTAAETEARATSPGADPNSERLDQALDWIDTKHPIYEAWTRAAALGAGEYSAAASAASVNDGSTIGAWERNETRLRGGDDVLDELRPFEWEKPGGDHYRMRQAQAVYDNFPEKLAIALTGHLLRNAPVPGKRLTFGSLGDINEEYDPANPTKAEEIWYNVDGIGNDGSQWNNWWMAVNRRAMATGHRWLMVEAPSAARRGNNREEEKARGGRPYLVEYSPIDVPNWHFETGRLQWAIVRYPLRRPKVTGGRLEGNSTDYGYLLLVRKGCRDLDGGGWTFSTGGWWRFDAEKKYHGEHGTWEATRGEIPMWAHFYERDSGSRRHPALSRPAITELGQAAISYMNLGSARDFDAWDSATSITWLRGVDSDGFNLALAKLQGGNRYVPLPRAADALGQTAIPDVTDSGAGAVAADVFEKALAAKRREAQERAAQEATSTPESSGASKEAGFADVKAPRLALMASETEQSQNTALHFLALRYSAQPDAYVDWPRDFDLAPLAEDVSEMFELQEQAGIKSPTLGAILLKAALKEKGLSPEADELEEIEAEWDLAAAAQATALAREFALTGEEEEAERNTEPGAGPPEQFPTPPTPPAV